MSAKEIAEEAIKNNEIIIFSKTTCPYCARAKGAISNLGYTYKTLELDTLSNGSDIQSALAEITGQRTVPNIFVKGKHIGGCDKTLALISSGEFQKLF